MVKRGADCVQFSSFGTDFCSILQAGAVANMVLTRPLVRHENW